MNKRQKIIVAKFAVVVVVTTIAALAMINIKDLINRSEGVRAMQQLGDGLLSYRQQYGYLPPESYLDTIKENVQGRVRLGKIQYRALWITLESEPNEILAYTEKNYKSLLINDGYIFLLLNGNVDWMEKNKFEKLLKSQQSPMEIKTTE
jgi:hypothetical protein